MKEKALSPGHGAVDRRADGTTRVRLREFSRSLPMTLLRARESVMRHFRPSLRAFDITEQQWRVLRALSSIADIEVTQLAKATCLLAPSLSRILKDLDERGLILRRTSEKDMRLGIVAISGEGLRLIERAGQASEQIYAEIGRRFGPAKIDALMDLLRQLETVLNEGDPIPAARSEPADLAHTPPARRRGRPTLAR